MLDKIFGFINGLKNYNYVPPKNMPHQAGIPQSAEGVFEIPSIASSWKGMVWHHSASKDNPLGNDWDGIRRYHMSWRVNGNIVSEEEYKVAVAAGRSHCEKPWSDIGYHLGIERVNGRLEVKIGRPWNKVGAHAGLGKSEYGDKATDYYNQNFLGCCIVGCYDAMAPDKETMDLCLAVTRQIMAKFGFGKDSALGHREVYDRVGVPRAKTCPGMAINLDSFRSGL